MQNADRKLTGLSQLAARARDYLPPEKLALVENAYEFAATAHDGQVRKSGEPYLEHPLQVALTLAGLQLDADALSAALLHDVTENCGVSIEQIESKFGRDVARLVDGTTKLGKVSWQVSDEVTASQSHLENLRKMLVAMAEDLRVVFIKLADRLHNMHTLDALPPEKQYSIAKETLEIYAPLAHRLGIWELKWQLEDLAFRYLEPEKYHRIASLIAARRVEREEFTARAVQIIKDEFKRAGLSAEVSGRPKHIYSIYSKMERYAAQGKDFDDIHDLFALRVLVASVQDCYGALGIVHGLWRPLPDAFNDFIANPKANGYQSLHTTVMSPGVPIEVQIRTREMHHIAEYGMAAHWRYKEGENKDLHFEEKISWLRQLIEWHRELSGAEEFLESVKTDIFIDQVFVYTPKGEIKDLPKGATPLDFAYRVHTDLGHKCVGAKVNGRLMPLTYQLKNGDMVEILTAKGAKGPSQDWLSPHLGYIKTSQARQKIRQWFSKQERTENIERGRELLDKELRHLGIKLSSREEAAKLLKYDSLDDFLAAIGDGSISPHQIGLKLAAQETPPPLPEAAQPRAPVPTSAIQVLGIGDLLTHLGQCCSPVPGDKIIGYITRSRGVTIHREDCPNITHEEEKERLVPVEWGQSDSVYPVNIQVEALNRVGLMRDISTTVAEEKVNIAGVSLINNDDYTVILYFTLDTMGLAQLSRLLGKIEGIRGVLVVTRVGDSKPGN